MKTATIHQAFRACSDPTRLRILHLLADGRICVGDLVEILGVPQPTASRHLACLRRAGLVRVEKRGRWCFYSLARVRGRFHRQLLACLKDCFGNVPELRSDRVRARKLADRGGCCPPVRKGVRA